MTKLVPKTHMLKSIRSRNWHLAGAIQELVDNSLGHGQASRVDILIDNAKGIAVRDNGTGVDDVNRIFTLGDASSHDKLSEIGQYGVGAKNATIFLGDIVTVITVHAGLEHQKTVNWKKVERRGEWPEAYAGHGRQPKPGEVGTTIAIKELAQHYQLRTSEKLAKELGQVFAPALRQGASINVYHNLTNGESQTLAVEPFTPADMTDEIMISGQIETKKGAVLRWSGRAGLSASLVERFNGVHIGFGHRIIETTREPFNGESAPTLYAEIALDDTTPWKHALSEHKDKVVREREALMISINAAIAELLEKSAQQAHFLALDSMIAPIETVLTKALRGAGLLHLDDESDNDSVIVDVDDEDDGADGGDDTDDADTDPEPQDSDEEGPEAKPQKPTGVSIDFRTKETLEGKLWTWEVSGKQMLILLDAEHFKLIVGYPPKLRDLAAIQAIAAVLAYAFEVEYKNNPSSLSGVITPGLRAKITGWDADGLRIAPYLNRDILENVRS